MSFVKRMKEFFGLKDGQTLIQFAAELKGLNEADRAEFVAWFNANNMPTEDATVTKAE